jgi:hypothetical protein
MKPRNAKTMAEDIGATLIDGIGKNASAPMPYNGRLLSSGTVYQSPTKALAEGRELRDKNFVKYPLLPEATFIYQQIVSGREWALGGKPNHVFKGLDFLNGARSKNLVTGFIEYGFEAFEKRRVIDHLLVGRTAFAIDKQDGADRLTYMDPTKLMMEVRRKNKNKRGSVLPVRPGEKVWVYDNKRYRAEDIQINHPLPIGSDLFVSPVSWLIPYCNLAWLINEHNSSALDGRRILDILMVSSGNLKTALTTALERLQQLYSGADVAEIGIPVVEITNMSGTPIQDLFAMVGLSNVPDSLNQDKFWFFYANLIAGTINVALRHFWNDERNTNRALEETQEARQQQKGPASFIRSEQRMLNESGYIKRAAGGDVRFGFIEESDLTSLKTKAEVLKAYGEAALSFQQVFGASLTLPSFMAWMKRIGAMPLDIELDENAEMQEDNGEGTGETAVSSSGQLLEEGETGAKGEDPVVAMEKRIEQMERDMQKGSIVVNQDGQIIGKRLNLFAMPSLQDLIESKEIVQKETEKMQEEITQKKALEYIEKGEETEVAKEVEMVLDYQLTQLVGEQLSLLQHKDVKDSEKVKMQEIENKILFNLLLSQPEVSFIEGMCEKYEVNVFDSLLEAEVE